jgi:hypothetical protein
VPLWLISADSPDCRFPLYLTPRCSKAKTDRWGSSGLFGSEVSVTTSVDWAFSCWFVFLLTITVIPCRVAGPPTRVCVRRPLGPATHHGSSTFDRTIRRTNRCNASHDLRDTERSGKLSFTAILVPSISRSTCCDLVRALKRVVAGFVARPLCVAMRTDCLGFPFNL